ncbi:hypothetical protein SAMN03097699_1550 [Flavobacteriaceae bacterium MAR_2010_188]|nr:hypothetical protein SAMN03097699_1550 [Flavobacteriaceae bacterium MAR_2010_188]
MNIIRYIFMLFLPLTAYCQENSISNEISINRYVDGTLLLPNSVENPSLVIIIPDSGPTDRNGNQNFLKNNSLKKLAEALAANNIATFRYDKRIVKEIKRGNVNLKVSFDDFMVDNRSVLDYFEAQKEFKNVFVLGHGQGSLVGMLSLDDKIKGFISVAGAGKSLDSTLIVQVQKTAPGLTDDTKRILNVLKEGKTTTNYPQALSSIFDIEIQPFMSSWIKYDPLTIIKDIPTPILILNGTKDLQVGIQESEELAKVAQNSEVKIIDNMNHVMFIIDGDDLENSKSYNEPRRSISEDLVNGIVQFVEKNKD